MYVLNAIFCEFINGKLFVLDKITMSTGHASIVVHYSNPIVCLKNKCNDLMEACRKRNHHLNDSWTRIIVRFVDILSILIRMSDNPNALFNKTRSRFITANPKPDGTF